MALFTNSATLSYNGTVATSNLVQGEVVGVLEITKTAVRASYLPGDRLTYAVTLTNTGSLPLSDLSVTEICFRTGFNNLTSFSRSFKKYTGMSPSDFRALSESYQDHISLFTEFRDGA